MIIALAMIASFAFALQVSAAGSVGATCATTADCEPTLSCVDSLCVKDTYGAQAVKGGLDNSLGKSDLIVTATAIINTLLGILGLVAVVIILVGGFKWMTAGGNEDKVGEARKMIFAGIIGLGIILAAWAIASFVITRLVSATGGQVESNIGL